MLLFYGCFDNCLFLVAVNVISFGNAFYFVVSLVLLDWRGGWWHRFVGRKAMCEGVMGWSSLSV